MTYSTEEVVGTMRACTMPIVVQLSISQQSSVHTLEGRESPSESHCQYFFDSASSSKRAVRGVRILTDFVAGKHEGMGVAASVALMSGCLDEVN